MKINLKLVCSLRGEREQDTGQREVTPQGGDGYVGRFENCFASLNGLQTVQKIDRSGSIKTVGKGGRGRRLGDGGP